MKTFLLSSHLFLSVIPALGDSWIQKADLGGNGRENAVGFSINDKGYIGTGSATNEGFSKTFWEYDVGLNAWTQKADLAGAGRESAVGFSIGGKGYVGLGKIEDCCYTDDFWEYDPVSNEWTQKANFPGGKRASSFAFTIGQKGYVGTGGTNTIKKQDFWEYDPTQDIWTKKANYGGGQVTGSAAFALGGKGYAGTGRDFDLNYRNDFWEYDPVANIWLQKTAFPGGVRTGSVGFSIQGNGYIGFGETLDTSFSDFWQYNPSTESWLNKSDYPGGGSDDQVGFAIGEKGYVGTGGASEKEFYQYSPDCITPTSFITSNLKPTSVKVSWDIVPGAETYNIRYRETGTVPWVKVTSQLNYKKLTGLSPDTEYDWAVKAVCDPVSNISSDWSATQNFTTKPLRLENEIFESEFLLKILPNPFSDWTTISLSVKEPSQVVIELWDLSDRKLATLLDQAIEEGNHEIKLDRRGLAEGIYLLKVNMNDLSRTMKVIIQ